MKAVLPVRNTMQNKPSERDGNEQTQRGWRWLWAWIDLWRGFFRGAQIKDRTRTDRQKKSPFDAVHYPLRNNCCR